MFNKGGNMTKHNHGAAISGRHSQRKLTEITLEAGFQILRNKKDFEKAGIDEWGTRYHKPPAHWDQKTPKGKQRKFESDGFIPLEKSSIIIEQKHSDKHGTTEEKVFYDLEKIRLGVYGKKHKLWYVFTGLAIHDTQPYKEFEKQVKLDKLDVKIIWGWEEYKNELNKIKNKKRRKKECQTK